MPSVSSFSDTAMASDMAAGVVNAIRPAIERLDAQVLSARDSQTMLASRLQNLSSVLNQICQEQPYELKSYSRKLENSRRRVVNTGRVLEDVQERLRRLQCDISTDRQSTEEEGSSGIFTCGPN